MRRLDRVEAAVDARPDLAHGPERPGADLAHDLEVVAEARRGVGRRVAAGAGLRRAWWEGEASPGTVAAALAHVQAAVDAHGEDALREMARDWPFFKTFLDDVSMVLAKGDLSIAEMYSKMAGELHGAFFPKVQQEHAAAVRWVLALNGNDWLLQHDQRLALSIRLRNPYIDPISVMQADLLKRWRDSDRQDDALLHALVASINGVSQGVQNTG